MGGMGESREDIQSAKEAQGEYMRVQGKTREDV